MIIIRRWRIQEAKFHGYQKYTQIMACTQHVKKSFFYQTKEAGAF